MKVLRFQNSLFFITVFLSGAFLLWKIFFLLPLYSDGELRTRVKTAMSTVADREGWLLSDMLVQEITREKTYLIYRQHIRGRDPKTCVTITLSDSSLHPCD